jgi:uncharacterized membrane-anchored protein
VHLLPDHPLRVELNDEAHARPSEAPQAPLRASHYSADLGRFRMKWERHSEFTRYKFIVVGPSEDPYDLPALPVAHRLTPWLNDAERELAQITAVLVESNELSEPVLLDRLTRLEAEIESHECAYYFRFRAAEAYDDLVERRIEELREARSRDCRRSRSSTSGGLHRR